MTVCVCWRNIKLTVHLEEVAVGGQILIKRIFKFEKHEVKWIGLSQGGDNRIIFVNTVMNIWFP
jgi:hypothetical protein